MYCIAALGGHMLRPGARLGAGLGANVAPELGISRSYCLAQNLCHMGAHDAPESIIGLSLQCIAQHLCHMGANYVLESLTSLSLQCIAQTPYHKSLGVIYEFQCVS